MSSLLRKSLLALLAAASFPAAASNAFYVVMPIPGKKAPAPQEITMSLNAYTLPQTAAFMGIQYSFDFHNVLTVTGDKNYAPGSVSWSLSGSLPTGLSFDGAGRITGSASGLGTFPLTVQASYKGKSATQNYSIVVNSPNPKMSVTPADGDPTFTTQVGSWLDKEFIWKNTGNIDYEKVYFDATKLQGVMVLLTQSTCGTIDAPVTLPVGASCKIKARFQPTVAGMGTYSIYVASFFGFNRTNSGISNSTFATQ